MQYFCRHYHTRNTMQYHTTQGDLTNAIFWFGSNIKCFFSYSLILQVSFSLILQVAPEEFEAAFDRVISIEMFEHMKNYGKLHKKVSKYLYSAIYLFSSCIWSISLFFRYQDGWGPVENFLSTSLRTSNWIWQKRKGCVYNHCQFIVYSMGMAYFFLSI